MGEQGQTSQQNMPTVGDHWRIWRQTLTPNWLGIFLKPNHFEWLNCSFMYCFGFALAVQTSSKSQQVIQLKPNNWERTGKFWFPQHFWLWRWRWYWWVWWWCSWGRLCVLRCWNREKQVRMSVLNASWVYSFLPRIVRSDHSRKMKLNVSASRLVIFDKSTENVVSRTYICRGSR